MAIIRGRVIPYIFTDTYSPQYTIRLEQHDLQKYANAFLSDAQVILKEITKNGKISNVKQLKKFGDAIAAYFMLGEESRHQNELGYAILEKLVGINKPQDFVREKLSSVRENIEHFKFIPSDTRFGANLTSLLYHTKVVTAIAWNIGVSADLSDEDLALLRIAALFHDIGKPYDWIHHVDKGVEICDSLLSDYVIDKYLNRIKEIIGKHHTDDKSDLPAYILRIADVFEASQNRLSKLIKSIMGEEFKEVMGFEFTDEWYRSKYNLYGGELLEKAKKLTKIFIQKVNNKDVLVEAIKNIAGMFEEPSACKDFSFAIVKGDARKIKKFVDRSLFIREMIGASKLISDATIDAVKVLLTEEGLIPESVIYVGGGNFLFFAPCKYSEIYKNKAYESFVKTAQGANVKIDSCIVDAVLHKNIPFGIIWQYLNTKVSIKKEIIDSELPVLPGGIKLCDSCKTNPASIEIKRGDKKYFYCKYCYNKYNAGGSRIETLIRSMLESKEVPLTPDFAAVTEHLMEFIAGMNPEDIKKLDVSEERHRIEPPNIAVLKADGNLMGEFFAWSMTLHEIIEKSSMVDGAIRKIDEDFNSFARDTEDPFLKLRLELGRIYTEGDDILWLLPSKYAFQLAKHAIKQFNLALGGIKELSVAIVSFGPKYPLPVAIELSENLLSMCKSKSRTIRESENKPIIGWIDYEIIESSGLTPDSLWDIRETISHMTMRPFYILRGKEGEKLPITSFDALFEKVVGSNIHTLSVFEDKAKEYIHNNISTFRRILELLTKSSLTTNWEELRKIVTLFTMRQLNRPTEKKESYKIALELLRPTDLDKTILLLDGYVLLKIINGGL